jgi:hypothetical protein
MSAIWGSQCWPGHLSRSGISNLEWNTVIPRSESQNFQCRSVIGRSSLIPLAFAVNFSKQVEIKKMQLSDSFSDSTFKNNLSSQKWRSCQKKFTTRGWIQFLGDSLYDILCPLRDSWVSENSPWRRAGYIGHSPSRRKLAQQRGLQSSSPINKFQIGTAKSFLPNAWQVIRIAWVTRGKSFWSQTTFVGLSFPSANSWFPIRMRIPLSITERNCQLIPVWIIKPVRVLWGNLRWTSALPPCRGFGNVRRIRSAGEPKQSSRCICQPRHSADNQWKIRFGLAPFIRQPAVSIIPPCHCAVRREEYSVRPCFCHALRHFSIDQQMQIDAYGSDGMVLLSKLWELEIDYRTQHEICIGISRLSY